MDLPIPATIVALDPVLEPALELAVRRFAEGHDANWRGVSWRRDAGTLNGVLPSPANSMFVLLEDGGTLRLSQHHQAQGLLEDVFRVLEGDHFQLQYAAGLRSAAGLLLCEDALAVFFQHPAETAARAEIALPRHVGGHGAFEALERLKRNFSGLLAIPGA